MLQTVLWVLQYLKKSLNVKITLKTDLKSLSLGAQIVLLETEKTLQEIHIFAHEDHSFQQLPLIHCCFKYMFCNQYIGSHFSSESP